MSAALDVLAVLWLLACLAAGVALFHGVVRYAERKARKERRAE